MVRNRARPARCVLLAVFVLFAACEESSKSNEDAGTDGGSNTDTDTDTECTDEDPFDLSQCPDTYPEFECTVHVDGDASSSGDGWSWGSAVRTVQAGIDLARCAAVEQGDCDQYQVWVKQGTYYIHQGCREHTVRLREQVALYGGFAGGETALEERDWEANETILDGRDAPDGEKHVYHVVWGRDDAVIDGFTVTGGRAVASADFEDMRNWGGGMEVYKTSPRIENCTFKENVAGFAGGGLDVTEASPTVERCAFLNNSVLNEATSVGGGMAATGSPIVSNCLFEGNSSMGWTGGLDVAGGSPVVTDCVFVGNHAEWGGGLVLWETEDAQVENCLLASNTADFGGALGAAWGTGSVMDCVFAQNSARAGGALGIDNDSLRLEDCVFHSNSASETGGVAFMNSAGQTAFERCSFVGNSALAGGGGVFSQMSDDILISNSTFIGNTASTGAGLWTTGDDETSPGSVSNCTFFMNQALSGSGGVSVEGGSVSVSNSVLFGNEPYEVGYLPLTSPVAVSHSLVEAGYSGPGNLDADPLFAGAPLFDGGAWTAVDYETTDLSTVLTDNAASWEPGALAGLPLELGADDGAIWAEIADNTETEVIVIGDLTGTVEVGQTYAVYDLRLAAGSPCIDAADGDLAPETDKDGNPRVDDPATVNTGVGTPEHVDIGAYEYQP